MVERTAATIPSHSCDTDESRWSAVQHRDADADGRFVYCVATTGVYCRPGCPSRLAHRRHVSFCDDAAAAERAGYRACKRCRPDESSRSERHATAITRACRVIESSETAPVLDELAQTTGLSPFHFHRIFKTVVGITPRQYFTSHRDRKVKTGLKSRGTITDAIHDAGFGSSSRFYERSTASLGMMPSEYKKGGAGVIVRHATMPCSLGQILVAATPRGICAVRFGESSLKLERELRRTFPNADIQPADSALRRWVETIIRQIERPSRKFDLPLDIRGTAFQHQVWHALRQIPAGNTASYADIAKQIGRPKAVRTVARACATNPVAVLVPCHRVIRSDGGISGYRWGVERKRQLLTREKTI